MLHRSIGTGTYNVNANCWSFLAKQQEINFIFSLVIVSSCLGRSSPAFALRISPLDLRAASFAASLVIFSLFWMVGGANYPVTSERLSLVFILIPHGCMELEIKSEIYCALGAVGITGDADITSATPSAHDHSNKNNKEYGSITKCMKATPPMCAMFHYVFPYFSSQSQTQQCGGHTTGILRRRQCQPVTRCAGSRPRQRRCCTPLQK